MVRKLRSCALCQKRFISVSETSEHCKNCSCPKSTGVLINKGPKVLEQCQEVGAVRRILHSKNSIESNDKPSPDPNGLERKSITEKRSNQQISKQVKTMALQEYDDEDEFSKEGKSQNIKNSPRLSSEENDRKKRTKLSSVIQEDVDVAIRLDSFKQTQSNTDIEAISIEDGVDVESVLSEAESDLSENLTLAQITANFGKRNELTNFKSSRISTLTSEDRPEGEDNQQVSAQGDICFICGCDFNRISTGFKGRLNHIKRCSKKIGVTANTMRCDDEEESFQDYILRKNQSANINEEWHGDAEQDLKLAENGTAVQQATITSFFATKVKSLNNVLMAGAKRLAKTNEVRTAASATKRIVPKQKRGFYARRVGECPSYKKIPGTDFVCDGFMYAKASMTKNYFLTHFHSDHYGGITKSWNDGIIYCSLPTANLVVQRLGVDKKYLHPLGLNSPVVIESKGKPVTVTLIDANHCPGAVMFLFHVGSRRVLHVGDFRWNREGMSRDLKDFFTLKLQLDDIFLDTTYCNKKYKLPSQESAINETIKTAQEEIESCRKTGARVLMLFGAYTIGKERLYLAVAERLGMKVYVDKTRYQTLSALNWPVKLMQRFTTDKSSTSLWVVPLGHINFKKLSMYTGGQSKALNRRNYDRIVAFRPTGWSLSGDNGRILTTRRNGIFVVHSVPYSEHSSFPELLDCINCLKPKRIIPTVSVSKSEEQVDLLLKELKKLSSG